MRSFDMFGELTIDESEDISTIELGEDVDTLILCNPHGREILMWSLEKNLGRIPDINRVTSLQVEPESQITDLCFIKAIPNLVNLILYGSWLKTLDGIEFLQKGQFVEIDTGTNCDRMIGRIGEATITRLLLRWARPEDIEAIGRSSTLRSLEMTACRELAMEQLSNVPIEELTLEGATVEEFRGSRSIRTLDDVILCDCRKLKSFEGDNSGVTRLIIEACNQLDFRTIWSFTNAQYLSVVNVKQEILLSWFSGLANLKELSLQNAKTVADVENLKADLPHLQELWVSNLKKAQIVKLSQINENVVVTNGMVSYQNGVPFDGDGPP